MGYIDYTVIAAYDRDGDEITAPAERYLEILVINGVLTLRGRPGGENDHWSHNDEPEFSIDVPAKSLLIAVKAALEEDDWMMGNTTAGPPGD